MYYILGIITGVVSAILIFALIRKATHQEGFVAKFDERQKAEQGKAYKFACLTMMILNGAALCWYSAAEGTEPAIPVTYVFLGIMLVGALVYASYAVWTDAYIGTNETYRGSLILAAVIAVMNLGIGISGQLEAGSEHSYVNLTIGVMFVVLSVEMAAKNLHDRHAEAIEAE